MSLYKRLHDHPPSDSGEGSSTTTPVPPVAPADPGDSMLPPAPAPLISGIENGSPTTGDQLSPNMFTKSWKYVGKLGVNAFMRSVGDFPKYKLHPIRTPFDVVVTKPANRRRAARAAEAATFEASRTPDRAAIRSERIDQILESSLSYADVLGYDEISVPQSPEARAYAGKLLELIEAGRGGEVGAATEDIRRRFEAMRRLLPDGARRLSRIANSESWINWDVAKQEVWAIRAYRSPITKTNYAGSALDNRIFGLQGTEAAERTDFMRDVVAWRHLGWELHQQALAGEDMSWLTTILPPEGQELLNTVGDEVHNGQLSSVLLAELGRYIDEALQTRAHVERHGDRSIHI